MIELNSDIINDYLTTNIDSIYEKIISATQKNKGKEENFRIEIAIIINDIFRALGIDTVINPEQEYSVANGRIDSLYGNIIIEYKAPGRISDKNNSTANKEFIEQVKRQISGLAGDNSELKGKILGVVFNGNYLIYVRYRNDSWDVSKVTLVDKESLEIFFKRLLSLSIEKKALTIEHLLNDFSSGSTLTKQIIKEFYTRCVNNTGFNKAKLLFEQWQLLFREVCGYDFDTLDLKIQSLKEHYGIDEEAVKMDCLIFSIHTYFALIIKFLSLEVLTYLSNKKNEGLNTLTVDNQNLLKEQLIDMESGGLYKKLGVSNFLEGDFFGWYIYLWDDEIFDKLKELVEKFRQYDYSSINLEPSSAKDLLKNVYHNLFPKELRHNLGEYYTPDWLAEFLINEMNIDFTSDKSILDPTCGSGTFIVLLIKNYISQNKARIDDSEMLNNILSYIRGYDLNPLAVISARANYIIALGDLFNKRETEVEIPVYLCDSMLTILEQKHLNRDCYIVSTKADNFPIPASLADAGVLNKVLDILGEAVAMNYTSDNFIARIRNEKIISPSLLKKEESVLKELFDTMYSLEQRGLDGIWANVIKNSFAPVFQKKVDYIIGNPPWIVWQSLPEEYRASIQKYWHEYKVFEHKGLKARLGSSHDDLAVLMTYVIMDNFLKDKGKLGFVINQNLFQSSGGGQGFRKLMIKDTIPVRIEQVNDFVKVQPFKDLGADNKTAVFTAIKNEKTTFPVSYVVWDKKTKGRIYADSSLESLFEDKLYKEVLKAKPVKEQNSSWIIGTDKELEVFGKMLAGVKPCYRARKGVDTSANAIYWVKRKQELPQNRVLVDNSPENSRKKIRHIENAVIEKDLLYPLLRGSDIRRWTAVPEYEVIVPYTCDGKAVPVGELKVNYPKAYNYFYKREHGFVDILVNRGIYKKHYASLETEKGVPEYVLYDIGEYTFSPYKVVWKALASGMIAVTISTIAGRLVIPDHNVVMIPIDDEDEAYYLSGILNAEIVSRFVNAYISWFFSTHILEHMHIPKYDSGNILHKKIMDLSRKAHIYATKDRNKLIDIEKKINTSAEILLING